MTAPTSQPFQAVCIWDAGIDLVHEDTKLMKYIEHRDISMLRFKSDPKPTIFHLRALPSKMVVQRLMTISNAQEARMAAFRACVVKVTNPRIDGWDSPSFTPQAVNQATDGDLSKIWELLNEDELELFEPAVILEIGEVAYGRAMLPKAIEGGFVLPPGSQRLLIVLRDLLADASQKRAEATSSAPPSSPTETPGSAPASGKTGDATAPADVASKAAAVTVASRLVDSAS